MATKRESRGESFHSRKRRWLFLGVLVFLVFASMFFRIISRPSSFNELLSITANDSTSSLPEKIQDFKEVAGATGTDKVEAYNYLAPCLKDSNQCTRGGAEREACRPWGHFYDTIYNRWLGKYSTMNLTEPIQFLEIGYFKGKGFEAYTNYLQNPQNELHSMEISCIEPGPRDEGKWPWGNFAKSHPMYESLLKNERLHCGDASDYDFLHSTWTTKMKRKDAPPLMVVVDDGAHVSDQMATSLFFWFPRIQPGGILVIEDIQPIVEANKFRTHIIPQVMKDLHWCGGSYNSAVKNDKACFPTIQPLLQGVHCEMHICVFVRNDQPAYEPEKDLSITPSNAFSGAADCLFG